MHDSITRQEDVSDREAQITCALDGPGNAAEQNASSGQGPAANDADDSQQHYGCDECGSHGSGLRLGLLIGAGLGGKKAEVLSQSPHLEVAGLALFVLDPQNGVVSNAAFFGDQTEVTDPLFKGRAHVTEKVFLFHVAHRKAFLPTMSRHFCLILGVDGSLLLLCAVGIIA